MERKILQEAAERFGTPSYLFDLDRLARRMETLKKALGSRAELCYAMKANPFLTGALRDLADRFEVCSPGEYDICRRLDIPEEKLVISGVNKSPEDTARMMDDCPRTVYSGISRTAGAAAPMRQPAETESVRTAPADQRKPVRHG